MEDSNSTAVQNIAQTARLFAALSDSTRLQLVKQLSHEGPQSISALTEETAISRQAVTKHLEVLEQAKLAASRRIGRQRFFELKPERLVTIHRYLDQIAGQWDEALSRLKIHVERE